MARKNIKKNTTQGVGRIKRYTVTVPLKAYKYARVTSDIVNLRIEKQIRKKLYKNTIGHLSYHTNRYVRTRPKRGHRKFVITTVNHVNKARKLAKYLRSVKQSVSNPIGFVAYSHRKALHSKCKAHDRDWETVVITNFR